MTVDPSSVDEETVPEAFVIERFGSKTFDKNNIQTLNEDYFSPSLWITRFAKNDDEAESLLQKFRLTFSRFFPFVVLPPEQSFVELKEKNPFVVLVVLMVGRKHDRILQTAIAKKIREVISYNVLVKGKQSLDLLQGVMLFSAWSVSQQNPIKVRLCSNVCFVPLRNRYHLHQHLGSQVCNLVHVMMALMTDLGLNNSGARKNSRPAYSASGYFSNRGPVPVAASATHRATTTEVTRSLEGRRAFLGCFFLTSV